MNLYQFDYEFEFNTMAWFHGLGKVGFCGKGKDPLLSSTILAPDEYKAESWGAKKIYEKYKKKNSSITGVEVLKVVLIAENIS